MGDDLFAVDFVDREVAVAAGRAAHLGFAELEALGRLEASESVPALAGLLREDRPYVRRGAAKALGAMGPEAKPAVGPPSSKRRRP